MKNPYPEDIFTKPTEGKYKQLQKCLEKCGLTLDIFSADISRRVWNICSEQIIAEIEGFANDLCIVADCSDSNDNQFPECKMKSKCPYRKEIAVIRDIISIIRDKKC